MSFCVNSCSPVRHPVNSVLCILRAQFVVGCICSRSASSVVIITVTCCCSRFIRKKKIEHIDINIFSTYITLTEPVLMRK